MAKMVLLYLGLLAAAKPAAQLAGTGISFASHNAFADTSYFLKHTTAVSLLNFDPASLIEFGAPAQLILGFTEQHRPVTAYYFPGRVNKRALVIGGMHGSELSSIAVAEKLKGLLASGGQPYYHTLIIPSLFPDNASYARGRVSELVHNNPGRYTQEDQADPNRQMPPLGSPFDPLHPVDLHGRTIEWENQLLLSLIQEFRPSRIVNLHAIRDGSKAGVFADPRTDCRGRALGFESDSLLAYQMAAYIRDKGGRADGNFLPSRPTVLYHQDPKAVPEGEFQPRNLKGSKLSKTRCCGVSLGSWAATAVCDSLNENRSRDALRLITVEFPGYWAPVDYKEEALRRKAEEQVSFYAGAILHIFLARVEEE